MQPLTAEQLHRLFYLLGALRDEVITNEEFAELNKMLEQNSAAQDVYLDYIYLCTDLCNLQAAIKKDTPAGPRTVDPESGMQANPPLTVEMLKVWGDYEKNAEILKLPGETVKPIVIGKVPVTVQPRQISKMSIVTLVTAIAAVLALILYVHLNPRITYEVATLSNAVEAQWSSYQPLQKGTRLSVSSADPIQLQQGVIEIESDKQVVVTIEGPAEFCFISPDEILMNYGRLYAFVPPSGSGFGVQTQNCKIIDIGTNFGVVADMRGETELHVFKGSTVLIAGQKGQNKKTVEVTGGQAFRVNSENTHITDIALNHNLFARGIDAQTGLLITEGKRVDLADIVGGGDGSGSGYQNRGIHWNTAQPVSTVNYLMNEALFPTDYVPMASNPLIDGIFIPHGVAEEPATLTSSAATLNLDEFIAADTNGLVTLMLLHETSDSNATYWFASKELAQNDPEKCPTLTFPNAPSTGSIKVTTAHKNGADAYAANDTLRAPTNRLGNTQHMACRYFKDKRVRMLYLRFDLTDMKGKDLSDALLSLHLTFGNRYRDLRVYGLKDGPADFWDEAAISFSTAPALLPAGLGNYQLDQTAVDRLGTFKVIDNRVTADPIPITADAVCTWTPPNTQSRSGALISNAQNFTNADGSPTLLTLDGIRCGTRENPSIFMHANAGITFDLQAIQKANGPVAIKSFTATCGIANPGGMLSNAQDTIFAAASFYVLVDGREVFSAIDMSPQDTPQEINIRLDKQARYLTLVTTQGTDNSITNDLCLFAKPALKLK